MCGTVAQRSAFGDKFAVRLRSWTLRGRRARELAIAARGPSHFIDGGNGERMFRAASEGCCEMKCAATAAPCDGRARRSLHRGCDGEKAKRRQPAAHLRG